MSNCTVKVKSLRVEGVPGVLRLDSSNSLSLHVHWVGADPRPVRPSQVTQELRVPVCGNIPLIKPGRLTGCGRRKLGLDNLLCINASFLMSQKIMHGLLSSAVAKNWRSGGRRSLWSVINIRFCVWNNKKLNNRSLYYPMIEDTKVQSSEITKFKRKQRNHEDAPWLNTKV